MRLYVDTADGHAITQAAATGFVFGVTTNPTLLRRASVRRTDLAHRGLPRAAGAAGGHRGGALRRRLPGTPAGRGPGCRCRTYGDAGRGARPADGRAPADRQRARSLRRGDAGTAGNPRRDAPA